MLYNMATDQNLDAFIISILVSFPFGVLDAVQFSSHNGTSFDSNSWVKVNYLCFKACKQNGCGTCK